MPASRDPDDRRTAQPSAGDDRRDSPHGDPPEAARSVPGFFEQILTACAPIGELDAAYDVELAVSALLGGAYAASDTDRDAAVGRFSDGLVPMLTDRADALAGALLAGLAGVAPTGSATRAAEALRAVPDESRPAWAAAVGRARHTGSWAMSDVFGDQAEYIVTFEYPDPTLGGPPHAICVLVDFNLGVVKDCWTALHPDDVLAACRRSAEADEDISLGAVAPETVRDTVGELFAATDRLVELPAAQGLSEERCVVLARLATLPTAPDTGQPDGRSDADDVLAGFLAAPEGAVDDAPDDVVEACGRLIAGYAVTRNRPDPWRWSPTTVETFLTDWVPRAAVLDRECVRWLPTVLAAFVTYAGRRSDRPRRAVVATQEAVTAHIEGFAELMFGSGAGQSGTGPGGDTAAQVARQLIADGVDPTDDAAVRAWLDERLRSSS